jgi:NitT/TauT family transport system substrate-binding protein
MSEGKGKAWFLRILVLVVALLVAAVGYAGNETAPQKVRFGYFPISTLLPVYVAQDKGYFAANGLQVTMTEIPGSPSVMVALAAGQLDVGSMSFISTVLASKKGVPVKLLASFGYSKVGQGMNGIYVLKGSAIKNMADLSGKKIGGNMKGTEPWFWTMDALTTHNVSNYRYIELGTLDVPPSLKSGTVDAAFLTEPATTMMRNDTRALIDLGNIFGACGYAFADAFVSKNPDAVKAWFRSLKTAIKFIRENNDEARKILAKYTRITPEIAKKSILPLWDDQSRILVDEAEREIAWMKKYKLISETPDLNKVFDYRFTGKAKLTEMK